MRSAVHDRIAPIKMVQAHSFLSEHHPKEANKRSVNRDYRCDGGDEIQEHLLPTLPTSPTRSAIGEPWPLHPVKFLRTHGCFMGPNRFQIGRACGQLLGAAAQPSKRARSWFAS